MKVKKSVHVDAEVYNNFKVWCVKHFKTVSEKMEEMMKEVLKGK